MDEMTPVERIQAAIALQPVDRVPLTPKVGADFAARMQHVKVVEVVRDFDVANKVLTKTFDDLGGWDVAPMGSMGKLGFNMFGMITKFPGYHLGDDELWQLDEKEIMTAEDYDFIIENGWNAFIMKIWPKLNSLIPLEELPAYLQAAGAQGVKDMLAWEARGIPTCTGFGPFVPMEGFRFSRSLKEIIGDLFRRPDKVLAASEAYLAEQLPQSIATFQAIKQATKWGYLGAFIGQQNAVMLSPNHFNKFFMPYEKRIVNAFIDAGITPWLHCDSDWTPYLERFLELPKGKCVLDVDSLTNIIKAKQILKGHMCIAGDVPPALLKLGTPEEVTAYCKKVIDIVGEDSGFILSSGCSVPIDAKPENVKALIDTGKNYYPHRKVH